MFVNIRLFMLYTCILLTVFSCAEKNDSIFVPTREWQTVKKGTPIPAGLHIRHNFQTGLTEAKLMDDEETQEKDYNENANQSQSKSLMLHPEKRILESENDELSTATKQTEPLKIPLKELKARLKSIKAREANLPSEINDEGAQAKTQKKFASYEKLKEELKELEVNITTDAEVLTTFLKNFQSHKTGIVTGTLTTLEIENVLDILNNLEYLIHQIDNAQLFTDMDGMTHVISPCLNSTYNEIKAEALRLLGAAVQSNPKVQQKAFENDLIHTLLHILSKNTTSIVKSRCLFALSALVRNFPAAQMALLVHGGFEIFNIVLSEGESQTQIKVMKLINDLVVEGQDLDKIQNLAQRELKTTEHAVIEIIHRKILFCEYCKHLIGLMVKNLQHELSDQYNIENPELLETINESMIVVNPICKHEFRKYKTVLVPLMNDMLNFCRNLSTTIKSDENDMINSHIELIQKLKTMLVEPMHEEL